ncbi:MAG TPA: hypothetical protein VJ826_04090 [Candidatus Polarisedimenticolaceae bacterium]|nr:hypothetical protein [Candidatus Polarisedimenticolaceae bacterium]
MNHRQQNDLIDPDVVGDDNRPLEHDPENPDDAFLIGEGGKTVAAPPGMANGAPGEAPPKKWVMPVALLLAAGALVLTVWNATRFMQGPPVPPVPTPVEAKQALYLGVMKIDAYRRGHGVTPDTMMDAGLAAGSGYSYTRVDSSHYVLAFEDRTARQTYDSTTPISSAFGPPKEMFTLGAKGDTE